MPDLTDIELVRLYADEPDDTNDITDDLVTQLLTLYDDNVDAATARVWNIKAGKLAKKVNVSTAQTRLELQSQFEHAQKMFQQYAEMAGGVEVFSGSEDGSWESVTMADAHWSHILDDEPSGMDAYWPGYGKQQP